MFLEDLGLKQSGLEKVIKVGYETLGEISFLKFNFKVASSTIRRVLHEHSCQQW